MTLGIDTLDVTEYPGKRQRLQTAINKTIYQRHLDDTLPFKLIMTESQYQMLKRTPEFGEKGQWETHPPEDRIYSTDYNAMEIVISDKE